MPPRARATRTAPGAQKVACSNCGLRELCLPVGFDETEMARLDRMVSRRASVARGGALFRAGERFEFLYAVRAGFFKTRAAAEDGREHVSGFQMAGDLIGLDGLATGEHSCDAIALEDSQVCLIPYARLEQLSHEFVQLQRHFHAIMAREILHGHGAMRILGSMRAEERLAAFLLNLSLRLEARGFSPSSLVLRMTREEMGSYLGLKLETVSRTLSKFQDEGLLSVHHRHIELRSRPALAALCGTAITPGEA